MTTMQAPPNAPPPIRTNTSNAFAYHTMTRRVPEGIQQILDRNPDYPDPVRDALKSLRERIENDEQIAPLAPSAPDYAYWQPQYAVRTGETWLDTDWFFAETYWYRKAVEITHWWESGRDPFLPIKDDEYASDAHWLLLEAALQEQGSPRYRLAHIIRQSLWGNRIDLSFPSSLSYGTEVGEDDLLVDETEAAVAQLMDGSGPVHLIADNAGSELTMDLALADLLLENRALSVMIHLKLHPTFVSDATPTDVWRFWKMLASRQGNAAVFGDRLRQAFDSGRLRLLPNLFWNSSYFLWEMPPHLQRVFAGARLVVIKGDANYRRMVGDAVWPADTPFVAVTSYFPVPLLALRTLKSDPLVGLETGQAALLDESDPRWRVNGKRGVVQFKL